jgi:hypothetical protein
MRYSKAYIAAVFYVIITSCSQKITTVYYNDTTKVDDGEIFGEALQAFFVEDKNIYIYQVKSEKLSEELLKIIKIISAKVTVQEPDDSYYTYAFISASKDTLFTDYRLSYWKYKGKSVFYNGEQMKPLIDSIVKR